MGHEITGLMDSLGWAILHSFWQGTLAAFAVIIFRNLTKDSQAALRYGFQVIALAACFVAFIVTFGLYHIKHGVFGSDGFETVSMMSQLGALTGSTSGSSVSGVTAFSLDSLLQRYTPLLGLLWCAGFIALSAKYSAAFVLTQRLRHRGLTSAPQDWQRRFTTLVLNSGVRRDVALFVSDRISGPLTLGFFKPMVLVPVGFFAGLTAEQAEAILLHEIAHIRRHDYMVNLLQTAIRTIFFFHPAIHFISRKIDNDREHACDDFAVALTHNPDALMRGLAALRLSLTPKPFTLAADGKNTPLVARLKRLGSPDQPKRRPEQVMTSVVALLVAGGLYTVTSPLADAAANSKDVTELADASTETHPSGKKGNYRFESISVNDKIFTAKIADDGSRWINVDGSWYDVDTRPDMIPALPDVPVAPQPPTLKINPDLSPEVQSWINDSKMDQYKIDVDYFLASAEDYEDMAGGPTSNHTELKQQMREAEKAREKAMAKAERIREEAMERAERLREDAIEQANRDYERAMEEAERQQQRAEEARDRAIEKAEADIERQLEQTEQQLEQAKRDAKMAERQMEYAEEELQRAMEEAERDRERDMERIERKQERAMERAERERERAERRRKKSQSYGEFSEAIMDQLKQDGLIESNADSVVITFPNKKMAVNGEVISRKTEGNYCKLLDQQGIKKTATTRISISPDMFDYEAKDGGSHHHVQETLNDYASFQATDEISESIDINPVIDVLPDIDVLDEINVTPISFAPPTPASRVTSSYGWKANHNKTHTGIDLAAPRNSEVVASAPGIVTSAQLEGRWGNLVTISHANGYRTRYAHMEKICVSEGDKVHQGEQIGTVGSTGVASGPHLHFEIQHNGSTKNPEDHVDGLAKT